MTQEQEQEQEQAAGRRQLLAEMSELRNQSAPLALEKKQLEARLSELNARVRENGPRGLPRTEFRSICNEQTSLKRRIVRLETKYQELKAQVRTKQAELDGMDGPPDTDGFRRRSALRAELRLLRNHWQAYADDLNRDEKSRGLALEFATELRELLALLDPTA